MTRAATFLLAVALSGCGGAPADEAPARPSSEAATATPPVDDSAARRPEPPPAAPNHPDPADTLASGGEWTVGRLEGPPGKGSAVLSAVRTGRQSGYDRVVFEFADGQVPGYRVEYVDSPQHQCGSGDEVRLPGQAWIQLDLEPAQAHDEQGRPTVGERSQRPEFPNLIELRITCDFEGRVTWVLGLRSPEPFRVLRLEQPARLVLDVGH